MYRLIHYENQKDLLFRRVVYTSRDKNENYILNSHCQGNKVYNSPSEALSDNTGRAAAGIS